jgi:hypothetical protein
MTSRLRPSHALAAPLAALTLFGAAACGSGDSAAGPAPFTSSPTTTAPTTAPSKTPTSESSAADPLSEFEGDLAVKALRTFAAAVGTSINDDDPSLKAAWSVMTAHGRTVFQQVAASDVKLFYPGPLPITPTRVQHEGATARISSCVWLSGWGQDPKTKLPAHGREVGPIAWVLHREGGAWKVDDQVYVNIDCSKVSVKGVAW